MAPGASVVAEVAAALLGTRAAGETRAGAGAGAEVGAGVEAALVRVEAAALVGVEGGGGVAKPWRLTRGARCACADYCVSGFVCSEGVWF